MPNSNPPAWTTDTRTKEPSYERSRRSGGAGSASPQMSKKMFLMSAAVADSLKRAANTSGAPKNHQVIRRYEWTFGNSCIWRHLPGFFLIRQNSFSRNNWAANISRLKDLRISKIYRKVCKCLFLCWMISLTSLSFRIWLLRSKICFSPRWLMNWGHRWILSSRSVTGWSPIWHKTPRTAAKRSWILLKARQPIYSKSSRMP